MAGVHSEPIEASEMEFCMKIVNSKTPLTVFTKNSIFDVYLGSE